MSAIAGTVSTENVVLSTRLDQELDLDVLSENLRGATYDLDRSPGLVYRTDDLPATSILFRSGSLVCTGAPSIAAGTEAVHKTVTTLRDLGVESPLDPEITVQNIVSTGDLETRLNLNAIAIGLGLLNVEYEPEQFPGLIYRPPDHDAVVLLFTSGKVVITGAAELGDAEAAIEAVHTRLDELGLLEETRTEG